MRGSVGVDTTITVETTVGRRVELQCSAACKVSRYNLGFKVVQLFRRLFDVNSTYGARFGCA